MKLGVPILHRGNKLASRNDGTFLLQARRLRMLHDQDRQAFRKMTKRAKLGSRKADYLVELAKQLEGITSREIAWKPSDGRRLRSLRST